MVLGYEHTIWHQFDPHRRAYAVLCQPRGREIARRLGLANAHQARECLICHAPAAVDHPEVTKAPCVPPFVTEGVGCEACHGKAGKWITAHTTVDWGMLSPPEKQYEFGLTSTKDLIGRATLCAKCHVGTAEGEVNHDLIAAGHPRLRFEFASHLARMPLHWDEKGENDRRLQPAFEARVWSVGQLATAQAQLKLIAERSKDAVWPEFADYSCYACHRELDGKSESPRTPLGKPAFGSWHVSMLPLLGVTPPDLAWYGDRATAAQQAAEAAAQLEPLAVAASAASYDPEQLRQRLAEITRQGPDLIRGEWDAAAQLYLAVAAWQQARIDAQHAGDRRDATLAQLLKQSRQELLRGGHSSDSAQRFGDGIRQLSERL